jgi:hypothetical protein
MLKRLLIIVMLPMLLLFAQQQMFAHEISHIKQSQQTNKHHSVPSEFCAQCGHLAGLSSGLLSDTILLQSMPYQHVIESSPTFLTNHLSTSYFSARAPPTVH